MGLIKQTTPNNIAAEKEKFFADTSYNPQLRYEAAVDDIDLKKYGDTTAEKVALAEEVLDRAYHDRDETALYASHGSIISQAVADHRLKEYLRSLGLLERYDIVWKDDTVSRTKIGASTITLQLPSSYRERGFIGTLNHEIGSHALRRINDEKQPFYGKKSKLGFKPYLITEEGIATLHSLLSIEEPYAFKQALRYLAVHYAKDHSFAEVWDLLDPYVDNPDRRWSICLRAKRGLMDTSQPGGLTKDLVYFEGMLQMSEWLQNNEYDLTSLYIGKIHHDDVEKAWQMNPDYEPLLPSFFDEGYAAVIDEIISFNHFSQVFQSA